MGSKPASCIGCPYYDREGPVWGRGSPNAKLATVAQNPWVEEWNYHDEMGRGMPLAGASGRVYNRNAELAGINREREFTTNIVKCLVPPGERLHPLAIAKCRPLLQKELALLERCKTILTLGQEAFNSLTGKELSIVHSRGKWGSTRESKATTHNPKGWLRGCPLPVSLGGRSFTIIPAAHPSYIMRTGFREAPILEADFRKAKRYAEGGGLLTYAPTIISDPGPDDIAEAIRQIAANGSCGLDIETPGKRQDDEEEIVFQGHADRIEVVGLAPDTSTCLEIGTEHVHHLRSLFEQRRDARRITVFTFNGGFDLGNIAATLGMGYREIVAWIHHYDVMLGLNGLYSDLLPKDLAMAMSLFTDIPYTKNLMHTNPPNPKLYNVSDAIGALWAGTNIKQAAEDVPAYERV